ncbi:MAG: helix-turn-helix domain-containing protein [Candidatus Marinimicrobia bacterium]|nr:helix-turn-helix domain-containing protein [Candidatus Neomarinimicrobiota bacterium]
MTAKISKVSSNQKYCPYCGQSGDRYYSVRTVAILLDCPEKTIRGWINDRTIGSKKVGGLRRISAKQLETFIEDKPSIKEIAEEVVAD